MTGFIPELIYPSQAKTADVTYAREQNDGHREIKRNGGRENQIPRVLRERALVIRWKRVVRYHVTPPRDRREADPGEQIQTSPNS